MNKTDAILFIASFIVGLGYGVLGLIELTGEYTGSNELAVRIVGLAALAVGMAICFVTINEFLVCPKKKLDDSTAGTMRNGKSTLAMDILIEAYNKPHPEGCTCSKCKGEVNQ